MEGQCEHTERLVQCLLSDFDMLQISHKHLLHAGLSSKYNEYSEKQEQKQNSLLFPIRMISPGHARKQRNVARGTQGSYNTCSSPEGLQLPTYSS